MAVLVTGGAGYIGSHMANALVDRNDSVVVLDDLSTGTRALVPPNATFIEGSISDPVLVEKTIAEHRIESIIHFAGSLIVPESVEQPLKYYANNTCASRTLIEVAVRTGVSNFIFSSTAAVYGSSERVTVDETVPLAPISPYGCSKLMVEWILRDTANAFDNFRYTALRYFNVAGSDPQGRTGQSTPHATHLIKKACQVALGRLPYLDIYGTDYPTPDGTGIRDYIHVTDLVSAHLLALDQLRGGAESGAYNCGYGEGISVRQVVTQMEKLLGCKLPVREKPRRAGDSAAIVADATRLRTHMNWTPSHNSLVEIISSALKWERKLRD